MEKAGGVMVLEAMGEVGMAKGVRFQAEGDAVDGTEVTVGLTDERGMERELECGIEK